VGKVVANEPMSTLTGQWVIATPESIAGFTAVGYHFGKEIYQKTGQVVGLINSSWGGTPAEAWTSDAQLETVERYRAGVQRRRMTLQKGGWKSTRPISPPGWPPRCRP
jgi:sialate O-acetylesterase